MLILTLMHLQEQVQFFFIIDFVIILHVRSQEMFCCIYLEILLIIVG